MMDYCHAPTPYLIGVHSSIYARLLEEVGTSIMDDGISIFDIDSKVKSNPAYWALTQLLGLLQCHQGRGFGVNTKKDTERTRSKLEKLGHFCRSRNKRGFHNVPGATAGQLYARFHWQFLLKRPLCPIALRSQHERFCRAPNPGLVSLARL